MKFVTAPLPPTYFEQQQMLTFCKSKNFAKQDWFWCQNNCNSTLYFCGLNITLISTVYLSPHVFTIIHIFYQTLSICNKSVWTGDQFLEVEKCSWFRNSRMLASKTFFMDCWVLSKESIFWTLKTSPAFVDFKNLYDIIEILWLQFSRSCQWNWKAPYKI